MAREATLGGKAWQTVSWLVLPEATKEATADCASSVERISFLAVISMNLERSPRSPRSGDCSIGTSVVRPDKGRMRFSEGTGEGSMTTKESAEKAVRDIRRKTRSGSHRRAQRRVQAHSRFVLANPVEIADCLTLLR